MLALYGRFKLRGQPFPNWVFLDEEDANTPIEALRRMYARAYGPSWEFQAREAPP